MSDPPSILAEHLAPQVPGLRLIRLVRLSNRIVLHAATSGTGAACPRCNVLSQRVHSHYQRTLADLPWGTFPVLLRLRVRKFFCRNPACAQRTFAERLPTLTVPYARRTARRATVLRALALALGGQAAARLTPLLALPTSRDSLLRLLRHTPLPTYPAPRVIGLDDWAYRRGHRYGTIIVDLERRQPIDLLPDRQPATVTAWLQRHPGIELICRDRAEGYAQAAQQGAPQAGQVADRWHLGKNLVAALEKFLLNKRSLLKDAVPPLLPATPSVPLPVSPGQQAQAQASAQRHARLLEYYAQIHALAGQHVPVAEIARQVEVSRETVYRYRRMTNPPSPKQPGRPVRRLSAAQEAYVLSRWNAGCRNAQQIWQDLVAQGYRGSARTVGRVVGHLRRHHGQIRRFRPTLPAAPGQEIRTTQEQRPYTAYRAALLFVSRSERHTAWQHAYLTRLCAADPSVATTYTQAQEFMRMIRERGGSQLDRWFAAVAHDGVAEVQSFAKGLQEDHAAVFAGLTLRWSQGQTEGQIHRLKLLKRQSYGRAGFALLRQRVLLKPEGRSEPRIWPTTSAAEENVRSQRWVPAMEPGR